MKKKYAAPNISLEFSVNVLCTSANYGSLGNDDFGNDIWDDEIN